MGIVSIKNKTKSGSLLVGNTFFLPTSYESIQTVTVGSGGQANVEFTSIPATFTHLQVRCTAQTNRGTYAIDEASINFNSDTTSLYAQHYMYGDGSSVGANSGANETRLVTGSGNFGTSTGSNFGVAIIDILDYANTNKFKTARILAGTDCNGTVSGFGGRMNLASGLYGSTNAITSIKLIPLNGTLFTQYSSFALYGIKVAS